MPFLTINGVTIPTAKGATVDVLEIGEKRRAFDGTLLREVRGFKRRWKLKTKPIAASRGIALQGLIQGDGLYFPFEQSMYAANGLAPTSAIVSYRAGVAADGAPVQDENGVLESKLGTSSTALEPAGLTQLLPAGTDTCSSAAGFGTLSGATRSVDTVNYAEGISSLKVITGAGAGSGVEASAVDLDGGITIVFSAYVKGTGQPVRLSLYELFSGLEYSSQVTVPNGIWRRIYVAGTPPDPGTWFCRLTSPSIAQTIYTDKWLLQTHAYGSFPTTWMPAATVLAAGASSYTSQVLGNAGATVNVWITKPYTTTGAQIYFAGEGPTAASYALLYTPAASPNVIRFETLAGGVTDTLSYTATYTGWHMLTAVIRSAPGAGEYIKCLYIDGVLRAQSNPTAVPDSLPTFSVGMRSGAGFAFNRMDALQVLPYPVDGAAIAGWYGGARSGNTPLLTVAGDLVHDTEVTCVGHVDRVEVVGFQSGNVWQPNGCAIDFTLEEI